MQVVRSLDEELWRRFMERHPASNVFHTPEMFQVFARTERHRPTLWAVTNAAGEILALFLPVQIRVTGFLPHCLNTRAVAYGSVLHEAGLSEGDEALSLLLRTYTREVDGAPLFTELRNLSDLDGAQCILREHRFVYEDHLNYLIDLNGSPEQIFQRFGPRTRKNLRRALKQGVVMIEEATDSQQISACYEILRSTYLRARVPLADRSLFESAFASLYPRGMVRFTLARVGSTPVAASAELLYKKAIYGWYGGVDRAYSNHIPNELLMWHILKWGAENGYAVYDFGGAGKPDEEYGVRNFKAKFGGRLVCYGRNTLVHAPRLLFVSRFGYGAYRRLLARSGGTRTRINRPNCPALASQFPSPPGREPHG